MRIAPDVKDAVIAVLQNSGTVAGAGYWIQEGYSGRSFSSIHGERSL
jgi:hypothetical protein